jgi:hypothetical protein
MPGVVRDIVPRAAYQHVDDLPAENRGSRFVDGMGPL